MTDPGQKTTCELYAGVNVKVLQAIGSPKEGKETLWVKGVELVCMGLLVGNPPPTVRDKRFYIGCPLGQRDARSLLLCRVK